MSKRKLTTWPKTGDDERSDDQFDGRAAMVPPKDRLLPFRAALTDTGIGRSKVYDLIKQKSFPKPIKIGRNNYFSETEIQTWIADQKAARDGEAVT